MIERLIEDVATGLGEWAYLLVAFMAMAETAAFLGFVAPGEFTIILGGVLAGEGTLSIQLLIGIAWASCVAGDGIGFYLGRRLGRNFALKHGPKLRITEERFRKVEDFFHEHGGKTIFIGRWVGLVRPLMPFLAGASRMSYRRFLPYDVLGAGMWAGAWCLLGYIFWRSFQQVASTAGRGTLAFAILLGLVIGGYQAIKRLRHPEQRRAFAQWLDHQTQRPLLRPLGWAGRAIGIAARPLWHHVLRPAWSVVAPPLRFIAGRLTPGELGIELTTLLAVAGVCVYVVVLQINLLETDALLPGDDSALQIARDVQIGILTTTAEVLAVIGRLWFVVLATAGVCAYLLARRRAPEAIVLAAGLAIAQIATHVIKDAVDRPRPGDGLVDADGFAYPSGHASIAIAYLALAVVLSRTVPAAWRVALVVAGTVVAAAIGLSRAYLRVHYLTDVAGGWAVGLAAFSLCGAAALVIEYLRQSRGDARPAPTPPEPRAAGGRTPSTAGGPAGKIIPGDE